MKLLSITDEGNCTSRKSEIHWKSQTIKRGHIKTPILTPSNDCYYYNQSGFLRKGQQEKVLLAAQIMKLTLTRDNVLKSLKKHSGANIYKLTD